MQDLYEIQCEELNPAEYANGMDCAIILPEPPPAIDLVAID